MTADYFYETMNFSDELGTFIPTIKVSSEGTQRSYSLFIFMSSTSQRILIDLMKLEIVMIIQIRYVKTVLL